jgi:hypothetical protein
MFSEKQKTRRDTDASPLMSPDVCADSSSLSDAELLASSSLFDVHFYLAANPDVAEASDPLDHYLRYGGREGRQPSALFDGRYYLDRYADVRNDGVNPLVHYLRFGQLEGRLPLPCPEESKDVRTEEPVIVLDQRSIDRSEIERSGLFDPDFYVRRYPDINPEVLDPLDHYMDHGWREGRRPHPFFDATLYRDEYPDVAESGLMPLLHFIRIGQPAGRLASLDPRLFGVVKQMINDAKSIEPSIMLDDALSAPELLTIAHSNRGGRVLNVWQKLYASLEYPFDYIVMMPWLVRGGADLAACNAVRAAIDKHGVDSTLVVLTDHEKTDAANWLPAGAHVRVLSEIDADLTRAERSRIIEMLITAMRPKAVLNVNSGALWDLILSKGGAMARATDLYASLFCRDYLPDGRAAGYADTHFKECIVHLKRAYFDNDPFREELCRDLCIPNSLRQKMVTVHQPISDNGLEKHSGGPSTRRAVLWAGRFCAQKSVNLLIEIARASPDFQFDVFGYGDDEHTKLLTDASKELGNLAIRGAFASTSQLPFERYNVFLYTSRYDGLPLTLADVASSGIPIVASAVGGIPDLVTHETGWPIEQYESVDAYVLALREVATDPELAGLKGEAIRARVKHIHSWNRYFARFSESPSFLDEYNACV